MDSITTAFGAITRRRPRLFERGIRLFLAACALLSVLTTAAIIKKVENMRLYFFIDLAIKAPD